MESLIGQFRNFITRYNGKLNIFEKRIAILILNHFDEVSVSTSSKGKRGRLISKFIANSINDCVKISDMSIAETINEQDFKQISNLTVSNFRGFSTLENIDMSKKYIFVYGRNGTGKSSFCEALEYSFLGEIEECKIKRIKLANYIKNIYTNEGKTPTLKIINSQGNVETLISNKNKYFFGFIERNRIEKFARISADTPQFQQQRLSSLFGLDDWNEFVHNFNNNIDNYLENKNISAKKLLDAQTALKNAEDFINSFDKKIEEIKLSAHDILKKYKGLSTSEEFLSYLDGDNQTHTGILKKIADIITKFRYIKPQGLEQLTLLTNQLDNYRSQSILLSQIENELDDFKGNMSLKQLYAAVINIKPELNNVCPACLSPIYDNDGKLRLRVDPYKNAKAELRKLSEGIVLENKIDKIKKNLEKILNDIKNSFGLLTTQLSKINYKPIDQMVEIDGRIDNLIEKHVFSEYNYFDDSYEQLKKIEIAVIKYNKRMKNRALKLSALNKRLDEISKDRDEIIGLKNQYKGLKETEKTSLKKRDEIKSLIDGLKNELNVESCYNDIFSEYRNAYIQLRDRLIEYTENLPISLIQFLENKTLDIYNFINKNDLQSEKLSNILLPKRPSEGINIFLNSSPENTIDALLYLSEGHLRCLGLSILLAKNLRDGLPFIIFDDVINAIDDEHRQAIAELILEKEDFQDKQWVVTTHAEEFIKLLDNMVSYKKIENDVKRIDFRRKLQPDKINLALDDDRNYLRKARKFFSEDKYRDSLAECRRGIESLITAIWKVYLKWYKEPIQVNLYSRNSPLESKSLFDNLLSCWKKKQLKEYRAEFNHLIQLMESVCEYGNRNPILWLYMNKGTHEEERDEEFIPEIIEKLLILLENIDIEIHEKIKVSNSHKLSYSEEK